MARPIGTHLSKEERSIRFIALTQKMTSGCVDWIGTRNYSGYGVCVWKRKHMRAHRVAYELFVSEIPEGKQVLHKCDRPQCVNPNHLFLGDPKTNSADCHAKGRANTERGSKRYNAKLNDGKVLQIRAMFQSGETIKKLASLFSVNQWTITNIILRRRWKHIN